MTNLLNLIKSVIPNFHPCLKKKTEVFESNFRFQRDVMPIYAGTRFRWHPMKPHGFALRSDFTSRFFPDSGFIKIRSVKTGKVKKFQLVRILRDERGELFALVYRSPEGYQVTILND